ncbi:MAG: PepSY domain-containing protein [Acidimicrobiales bacterium]
MFIDQFNGQTLAEQRVYGMGAVYEGMDTLVSVHMGTQLGIFSRIMMTVLCVLAIWSVLSGFAMFWKRRRRGTLGLPRRPVDVRLSRKLAAVGVATGIVFPQWAASALLVLGFDRFVIRRSRLRTVFGQST